jgi:quercetin dioxygenase-like cupin family protein
MEMTPMPRPGDVIEHPGTRERVTFLETREQTRGECVRVYLEMEPTGIELPAHVHPQIEEEIEIVDGTWTLLGNGTERLLRAGEVAVTPAGHAHSCWNTGTVISTAIVTYRPALAIAEYLETIFGLAQDGLADPASGLPAQPWLALVLDSCLRAIAHPAAPPLPELLETFRPIADEAKRQGLCIPCPYPYPYRQ